MKRVLALTLVLVLAIASSAMADVASAVNSPQQQKWTALKYS